MKATQPVEAPGASTATQPVEGPGALIATQPVEAPGAFITTQPVEAPGATTVMHPTDQDVGDQNTVDRQEVPEFDSFSSSLDNDPYANTRTQHTGKVSVKVPVDEWLCWKMEKLNVTVYEGYPSHSSETAGLSRDQFVKPPKTLKWYDMYSEKKNFSRSKEHSWTNEHARLNSSFPRITSHLLPSAPSSRPVSQDTEKIGMGCLRSELQV